MGNITSLVCNDEVVFKIIFFHFCHLILKLTDSQLEAVTKLKVRLVL